MKRKYEKNMKKKEKYEKSMKKKEKYEKSKEKCEPKLEFPEGWGGFKPKQPSNGGEYGCFLEQHIP